MFSLAQIAAAAAALVIGGTGSAALVSNAPPSQADVAATMTAKANADLTAAEKAQQLAIDALSSATAEGKAEAEAQIEAGSASLEKASAEMKAAVETGSKAAVNAFSEFTRKSVLLVNGLATTASASANASVKAGSDLVKAVDHQLETARGVATAQGNAAVAALSQAKAELPATIGGTLGSDTGVTVSGAAPSSSVSANVKADVQSPTGVSSLPVVSSTASQVGAIVRQK